MPRRGTALGTANQKKGALHSCGIYVYPKAIEMTRVWSVGPSVCLRRPGNNPRLLGGLVLSRDQCLTLSKY